MNILLFGILLSIGAFLFFLAVLLMMHRERSAGKGVASLSIEDPQTYARQSTIAHMVSKKGVARNWPLPELKGSYKLIRLACGLLNDDLVKNLDVPAQAEWLLDNFYIIESQYRVLLGELRKKDYLRLPVLQSGPYKGYARVFAMAIELISGRGNLLDDAALAAYFSAYQAKNILLEREVRALPVVLRLVTFEDIRFLCEDIISEVKSREKADAAYDEFMKDKSAKLQRFHAVLTSGVQMGACVDLTFAEHLCFRLRRSERSPAEAMLALDEVLSKLGTSADEVTQLEHSAQSLATVAMESCVKRLHYFSSLDWSVLLPAASRIEQILREGGDGVYAAMDLATRDAYKRQVSRISALARCSEVHTAREAVRLAADAGKTGPDAGRTGHVGYYLVDEGAAILERHLTGKKQGPAQSSGGRRRWILYLSALALVSAAVTAPGVLYGINMAANAKAFYGILCGLALLPIASAMSVYLVNRLIGRVMKPKLLPKLELKDGIPQELSTMVIIPTLLPDTERVAGVLQSIEEHYLRNREQNLYFAVIGAFGDAAEANLPGDGAVTSAALAGVAALNAKYAGDGEIFYFFHRERQYNRSNNVWIGWERKRGAIMEFNDLVQGLPDTSFVCKSSDAPPFERIRYVITLDSETILPIGMAKRLIGTMAHPLNRR